MAWLLLLLAVAFEIAWPLAFKEADGFSHAVPALLGVAAAVASLILLVLALRDLPVGTAYAAWTGLGAVAVALAGIGCSARARRRPRLGCLALVAAGVAGLRLVE